MGLKVWLIVCSLAVSAHAECVANDAACLKAADADSSVLLQSAVGVIHTATDQEQASIQGDAVQGEAEAASEDQEEADDANIDGEAERPSKKFRKCLRGCIKKNGKAMRAKFWGCIKKTKNRRACGKASLAMCTKPCSKKKLLLNEEDTDEDEVLSEQDIDDVVEELEEDSNEDNKEDEGEQNEEDDDLLEEGEDEEAAEEGESNEDDEGEQNEEDGELLEEGEDEEAAEDGEEADEEADGEEGEDIEGKQDEAVEGAEGSKWARRRRARRPTPRRRRWIAPRRRRTPPRRRWLAPRRRRTPPRRRIFRRRRTGPPRRRFWRRRRTTPPRRRIFRRRRTPAPTPAPSVSIGGATPALSSEVLEYYLMARFSAGPKESPPRQLNGGWTRFKTWSVGGVGNHDSMTIFTKPGSKVCTVGFECMDPISLDMISIFLGNWFATRSEALNACGITSLSGGFNEELQSLVRQIWWTSEVLAKLNSADCSGGLVAVGISLGAALADIFSACTNNAPGPTTLGPIASFKGNAVVHWPTNKVNAIYTFHGLPVSTTQISNHRRPDRIFPGKRFFSEGPTFVDPATTTGCGLGLPFFPAPCGPNTPWCGMKHPKVDAVQFWDPAMTSSMLSMAYRRRSSTRRRRASMILTPASSSLAATVPTGTGKHVDFSTFYGTHSTPLYDELFNGLYGFTFRATKGAALLEKSNVTVLNL